ncbi:endonuclease VII domain-containing protein [Streptomyces silvensis]|uniref:endonuclease VII domain-containing protein n=1 Tax=Streptomyces silvensis TaxID=1765722 RepID=UPI0007C72221|nr:endonuclease VII domain-containing protein [Streptomyces silvensis]
MYPALFTTPGVRQFAEEIDAERQRQIAKFGDQHHPDGTGLTLDQLAWAEEARERCQQAAADGSLSWAHILEEEVAEALAEADPARLREEILQVAAVCAAWVHDLDTREACPKCKTSYEVLGHHKTRTGRGWCRKCASEYERLRREANKDVINARRREVMRGGGYRAGRLRRYGLTPEAFEQMAEAQGNACAICRDPGELHVDHSHDKGHVRGLLCNNCNNGLGRFRDNPDFLLRAADYAKATADAAWVADIDSRTAAEEQPAAGQVSAPLPPELVSAILRDPDSPYYPSQITVVCDHCGAEDTSDYMVREDMTPTERLGVARMHLVDTKGWEHDARVGDDFCPVHASTSAAECAACRTPFDPADSRHDGRARYGLTDHCRCCVDRCHESTDVGHRCPVCA